MRGHGIQVRARIPAQDRHERGAALLVTMLLLALLGVVGMASMDTVTRDRQAAGYMGAAQAAFYAADAAVSESLDVLRTEVLSPVIGPGDCLGQAIPTGSLPNGALYGADATAATDEICMAGIAEDCDELVSSAEIGGTVFRYTVWNLRTEGTGTGGGVSRIQATARRCHAFGS